MSVMSESQIGLGDLITMGYRMIATAREALDDLEAFFYLMERWLGQKGEQDAAPVTDDSVPPEDMTADPEPQGEAEEAEQVAESEPDEPADAAATEPAESTEPERKAPAKTASLEEVRPVLAYKTRKGFRAEVKALLTKYGAEKLSDIKDEAVLGAILAEAERLGETA